MPTTLCQRFAAILAIAMLFMCPLATLQADKIIDATQYSGPCYNETVYWAAYEGVIYSDNCTGWADSWLWDSGSFEVQVCPNDYFEWNDYNDPQNDYFPFNDWVAHWTCENGYLITQNYYLYW